MIALGQPVRPHPIFDLDFFLSTHLQIVQPFSHQRGLAKANWSRDEGQFSMQTSTQFLNQMRAGDKF
jgi:hypothetical protein